MLRDIIERFAGRYEIWRDEQRAEREAADGNPYRRWLWIICAFLAWDIYKFVALHQFDWRSVQFSLLSIVFLLTYFLSPRRAWLVFLIVGVIAIVESPSVYAINPFAASRYRDRHVVSGAKSDPGDAKVLADQVRTDRHNHRPVAARPFADEAA